MIEITIEEILEDLCYPFPPPGSWPLPAHDEREAEERIPERRLSGLAPITP